MINFLKGKIEEKGKDYIAVDVCGVGYKVYVADSLLARMEGEDVKIYTYHHIRENLMDLYGFENKDDLDFFKILLSVSGVGPKSAMSILEKTGRENIKKAVSANSADMLSGFGIGKKTADRLVIELKNKLGKISILEKDCLGEDLSEAINGLEALGYSKVEATVVLRNIPVDIKDTGEKIKWALKNL